MYHVNDNGDVTECRARRKPCRLAPERHFETLAGAYEYVDGLPESDGESPRRRRPYLAGIDALLSGIMDAITGIR